MSDTCRSEVASMSNPIAPTSIFFALKSELRYTVQHSFSRKFILTEIRKVAGFG